MKVTGNILRNKSDQQYPQKLKLTDHIPTNENDW